MRSAIIVTEEFDGTWPFAADDFHAKWKAQSDVEFVRLAPGDERPVAEVLNLPKRITRLATLGYDLSIADLKTLPLLEEWASSRLDKIEDECRSVCKDRNIQIIGQPSEGFWKQSVAETGLGLTICGLRQIPQKYQAIQTKLDEWNYSPAPGKGAPGMRGAQYCDDNRFTSGTIHGKRIRIVGAGNIASHYASIVSFMGADVSAYDPYVPEPSFDLAGVRRVLSLEELVEDAEIFVPMVPLTDATKGLVTADHINRLPKGCLVVLVTRALICDMDAVRRRVLNDEISLAADVFDVEPLPLDDPLLGRHNVIHTPHIAGRTRQAKESWVDRLICQFKVH